MLTPVLSELASDPTTYARVFQDVVQGDNKIFNDECCVAGPGYDLTTGLGQLQFAALTEVLIARAHAAAPPVDVPVPVPRFTG